MTSEDIQKAAELRKQAATFRAKRPAAPKKVRRIRGASERLSATAAFLKERIIPEVTPKKGRDYFDGATGMRGPKGERGRPGRDGADGQDGKNGVALEELKELIPDTTALVAEVDTKLAALKESLDLPTVDDVLTAIKDLKGNDRIDISNIRNGEQLAQAAAKLSKLNMDDERWHGAGYIGVNTQVITVDIVAPTNPHIGDLWVDSS